MNLRVGELARRVGLVVGEEPEGHLHGRIGRRHVSVLFLCANRSVRFTHSQRNPPIAVAGGAGDPPGPSEATDTWRGRAVRRRTSAAPGGGMAQTDSAVTLTRLRALNPRVDS